MAAGANINVDLVRERRSFTSGYRPGVGNAARKLLEGEPFVNFADAVRCYGIGDGAFVEIPFSGGVELNITSFGGRADAPDNSMALNIALSFLPARGGHIKYPSGKFTHLSPINYTFANDNQSVSISGVGQNATELYWPTTDGVVCTMKNSTTTFHMRDVAVTSGTAATKVGVKLTVPGSNLNAGLGEYSDFTRCVFRGTDGYAQYNAWSTAVDLDNVSNVNFLGSTVAGTNGSIGKGIATRGRNDNSLGVVYNVSLCSFVHLNVSIEYGSYVQGMTVVQSNFTAVTNGIVAPPNSLGILSQLSIVCNQFATNPTGDGAAINIQTGINPLTISGNLFLSNGMGTMINLLSHSFTSVSGNEFFSPAANNNTAINCGVGNSHSKVNDNIIFGFLVGISLPVQAGNVSVTNNILGSCTTPIANGGTAANQNRITGNAGFQPQAPVAQSLAASPWNYATPGVPATVFVTGGTVSAVRVDGVLIAQSAPGPVPLEPNQSISITYTVAPFVVIAVR